jgi:hypothetical protein
VARPAVTAAVDAWTRQALGAAGHLVALYRALDDDRQASCAMRALGACEERARRLGLRADPFPVAAGEPETVAEARAWSTLLEAQAGLLAFHAVVGAGPGPGLQGNRSATHKAFRLALQCLRTAFPEALAAQDSRRALARMAGCLEAFTQDLAAPDPDLARALADQVRGALAEELPPELLEGLCTAPAPRLGHRQTACPTAWSRPGPGTGRSARARPPSCKLFLVDGCLPGYHRSHNSLVVQSNF